MLPEVKCIINVQKGALDYVGFNRQKNVEKKDKLQQCQELLKEGQNPSFETLKLFADFRFFDEGETLYLAKPKSIFYYIFHVGNLKRDFLSSRWKIGFMKRLFKISLPYEEMYRAMLKYK